MNTLAHLAATVALLWLSIFAFSTLAETALGVAILAVALLWMVLTLLAIVDDFQAMKGRERDE